MIDFNATIATALPAAMQAGAYEVEPSAYDVELRDPEQEP